MAAVEATVGALDPVDRTLKIENTEKRDTLIAIEKRYQQKWAEERVFETDAPSTEEVPFNAVSADELRSKHPKFFGTMAYPYMNGSLHVGHGFTYSKIEFAAGVARMQGLRTNLPLGYHCTGMPINSAADKIAREVEMFGKNFERCPVNDLANGISETGLPAPTQEITKTDVTKFSATKGKAAAKTVKMKYQFQIMLSIGIPLEEIHLFAEPMKWLQHFPPICKQDLTGFGARIDWRRSMVTTDANLFYDAFVRWQMVRLKEAGKIRFGKRYTVYSPKDGQACMDHDRSQGEGVGVQEYTALKIAVKEWPESAQKSVSQLPKDARCFFVAATLRPETVYGQLCCFVGPSIRYGIYKVSNGEYYVLSERAARNMSFQGVTAWGEVEKIVDVLGSDLVGAVVAPPLSANPEVRILPMESVKASKGTGIVMCVPSDSPDDYVTLRDLAKKADYYGIRKEWADLEIIPIIETPTYGNLTAKAIVEQMKINSPKDAKQLAEAKDLAYKEGFYRGVMIYGPYKGKTVEEAKPLVRAQLLEAGEALAYAETDGVVVSRSGDECVAAHLDQWYMAYGKKESPEWQQEVLSYVTDGEFNSYSADTKNALEANLDWLGQW
ncbi:hypothetical protein B0A49_01733 [Cryomyces minteri]|uniref:leucine--tRNA ligase n=1 Tax=Cryomyces minteri TaxID=331657 RepID=A0A4U0VVD3_9PEZI|nr:hypothetical protein B0A49_08971 [Cryomyces minteri]TKA76958.1 hypothetical protein B0A49_01733 [Cryomyces minteri]